MLHVLKAWFLKRCAVLMHYERSPHRLAAACCWGIYIAFSPFIGLHTVMIFLCSQFFKYNFFVLFSVATFINNPWTMVPVYAIDYTFGSWIFNFLQINSMSLNPQWVVELNYYIAHYTGIEGISLWSFLLGGNLLGIAISGILYPILIRTFRHIFVTL